MSKNYTANDLFTIASQEGPVAALSTFGKNISISIPMTDSFRSQSIEELDLSVRARNALMRSNARTIGAVCDLIMSESGISAIRNLGRKSISEIKTVLFAAAYNALSEKYRRDFWTSVLEQN